MVSLSNHGPADGVTQAPHLDARGLALGQAQGERTFQPSPLKGEGAPPCGAHPGPPSLCGIAVNNPACVAVRATLPWRNRGDWTHAFRAASGRRIAVRGRRGSVVASGILLLSVMLASSARPARRRGWPGRGRGDAFGPAEPKTIRGWDYRRYPGLLADGGRHHCRRVADGSGDRRGQGWSPPIATSIARSPIGHEGANVRRGSIAILPEAA